MNYVGLDVHKRFTYGTVKDREGVVLAKERFDNSKENFQTFLKPFPSEETKIVMESTGVWQYIYDLLEDLKYEAKLANPVRTKAIAYAKIKTDAVDSGTLADLNRADLIAESYVPPKNIRQLRDFVRLRKSMDKQKNQTTNRLHALLTREGIQLPTKTLGKKARKYLKEFNNSSINLYLELIEVYEKKIEEIDKSSEAKIEKINEIELIISIHGFGPVLALRIYAEIGEISRFANADKLCSYSGLVPSVKQSGNTLRFGRLVKQASRTLKHAFIQAAWSNVRAKESNPIQEHYKKLAKKKGKQKAICAAARKLCCVTYAVLKKKEPCHYS